MGYVDVEKPNVLKLNNKLFGEYKLWFENAYIHETLHQLGFRNNSILMLDEGITDAFTDLILRYMGRKSEPTSYYSDIRNLAYEIIKADFGIASFYLETENLDITHRITEKLKDVKRPFLKVKDVGGRLEWLAEVLFQEQLISFMLLLKHKRLFVVIANHLTQAMK